MVLDNKAKRLQQKSTRSFSDMACGDKGCPTFYTERVCPKNRHFSDAKPQCQVIIPLGHAQYARCCNYAMPDSTTCYVHKEIGKRRSCHQGQCMVAVVDKETGQQRCCQNCAGDNLTRDVGGLAIRVCPVHARAIDGNSKIELSQCVLSSADVTRRLTDRNIKDKKYLATLENGGKAKIVRHQVYVDRSEGTPRVTPLIIEVVTTGSPSETETDKDETKRHEDEDKARRKAEKAEAKRREEEDKARRKAEKAEAKRRQEETEAQRHAEEQSRQEAILAQQRSDAASAEARRKADEADEARRKAQADQLEKSKREADAVAAQAKKAQEGADRQKKLLAETRERQRKAEEEARKKAEEENKRQTRSTTVQKAQEDAAKKKAESEAADKRLEEARKRTAEANKKAAEAKQKAEEARKQAEAKKTVAKPAVVAASAPAAEPPRRSSRIASQKADKSPETRLVETVPVMINKYVLTDGKDNVVVIHDTKVHANNLIMTVSEADGKVKRDVLLTKTGESKEYEDGSVLSAYTYLASKNKSKTSVVDQFFGRGVDEEVPNDRYETVLLIRTSIPEDNSQDVLLNDLTIYRLFLKSKNTKRIATSLDALEVVKNVPKSQ